MCAGHIPRSANTMCLNTVSQRNHFNYIWKNCVDVPTLVMFSKRLKTQLIRILAKNTPLSLVDPGGPTSTSPPTGSSFIFALFHIHFHRKVPLFEVSAPKQGQHPPRLPAGNPGSATACIWTQLRYSDASMATCLTLFSGLCGKGIWLSMYETFSRVGVRRFTLNQ